ncbi:MAG TPA: ABC transporter permease [Candidatus Pullichristensenella stercorigallinarum]|uniref:ABC transporter permease n=1 Tax=Candidatus Pullichristensenella stercorigallinarum TaxID=2840909 RepID=A0A9D0ZQ73_9FIRM|nr:ABC transporter permease [Candidatus Pullichristensenella stercorigallinarum]
MNQRTFLQSFVRNKLGMVGLFVVLVIVLVGICAPLITPKPTGYGSEILMPPSREHPFGTDNLGLDIFGEIVWGARASVYVSAIAVCFAAALGLPLGLISGYFGGRIGGVIDSLIEIFMTLPMMALTIVIAAVAGSSVTNVAIAIGVTSWPSLARVTRNATMRVAEMPFIEVSRCLGLSRRTILGKHVLINVIGPVMVNLTLVMATAVLSESGLSFLGLGDPNTWSWGLILKKAWDTGALVKSPNPIWWWTFPSLAIMLYVVCFNILGNAINDTLNPKAR